MIHPTVNGMFMLQRMKDIFTSVIDGIEKRHSKHIIKERRAINMEQFELCGGANILQLSYDLHGITMKVVTPQGGILTDLRSWKHNKISWLDPDTKAPMFMRRSFVYHDQKFAAEYKFLDREGAMDKLHSLVTFVVQGSICKNLKVDRGVKLENYVSAPAFQPQVVVSDDVKWALREMSFNDVKWALP